MVEIFLNTDASFHLYLEMICAVNWNFSDGLNSNNLSPIASLSKLHKVSALGFQWMWRTDQFRKLFPDQNFFNLKTGNWASYINMILLG